MKSLCFHKDEASYTIILINELILVHKNEASYNIILNIIFSQI